MRREEIVKRILDERMRQFDLPGREYDVRNTPGEWSAIAAHYAFEELRRGALRPNRQNYEDSLIKAAAVLIAALEHCDMMETRNHFDEVPE